MTLYIPFIHKRGKKEKAKKVESLYEELYLPEQTSKIEEKEKSSVIIIELF